MGRENNFLKLPNSPSSNGREVKVLNRNLRGCGQQLHLPRIRGSAPRPAPRPCRLAAAGRRGPVERPRPTGSLKGAQGGRAAAWPARKENLLPAEAVPSPARLLGSPSPRDRPALAWPTGRGRGTLDSLRDSCRNGHSLGRRGCRLFPPFRHDPIQKSQMKLPGRTGIFGALNSWPSRNSNESLIDQHLFTSWNELLEMGIVLLDPTCSRWLLLHGDYVFKPTPFLIA
nr:PREDICTED: uncharacterized protein LOC103564802 [Equus przewalskii]